MRRSFVVFLTCCCAALGSVACDDEIVVAEPGDDEGNEPGPGEGEGEGDGDPTPPTEGGEPGAAEGEGEGEGEAGDRPDCSAFEHHGVTYACAMTDKCPQAVPQDLRQALACCTCDPWYCDAPSAEWLADICQVAPDVPVDPDPERPAGESCMACHNGSRHDDYSGPGLADPHPYPAPGYVRCTGCHGGDGAAVGKLGAHVAPPPEIGDRQQQQQDPRAAWNRTTLIGADRYSLEWLQFVNPGDLRVVSEGRSCGAQGCHGGAHGDWVPRSIIATNTGFFSTNRFMSGIDNAYPDRKALDGDTLADLAPRPVNNPDYDPDNRVVGEVPSLMQIPSKAHYNPDPSPDPLSLRLQDGSPNPLYLAGSLALGLDNSDPQRPNRARTGGPLAVLVDEASDVFCADCHLYSAGFNNRYGDFRSSGCTACHMTYSLDGRSRSSDPNVRKNEPANPDAIAAGERSHVATHRIRNVARITEQGGFVRGVEDAVCVGCHSGSNRTVLQYWGIRLDQNQDVTGGTQYPANPANFTDATGDTRLYDPAIGNATFNGRVPQQHLTFEDYDGDGRDDIPADIHYEAGMGCIDCHGSRDLHGGTPGDPSSGKILSHMSQGTMTTCESCHGTPSAYAPTKECTTYEGRVEQCVYDKAGNPLRHTWKDPQGQYWLVSRVTGRRMAVTQTRDSTVAQTGRTHPLTGQPYYSPKASYHHGRSDGDAATGIGPIQQDGIRQNFSHMDNMDCTACHASWTNNCIGCHLGLQYNADPNTHLYSMVTGERIVLQLYAADFTYQTPVPFFLGITSRGKISQIEPAEKVFWRYTDYEGTESAVLTFGDRTGQGNSPGLGGRNDFPALGHNETLSHSMRGAVTATDEGARYCVACHLTEAGLDEFGDEYQQFIDLYRDNNDFTQMQDEGLYALLAEHIGANPGNQLNSPLWVHMVAGLGSGLFTMDNTGCPENPLDDRADRQYCPDGAPADNFAAADVVYDVDRLVEITGVPNASTAHPFTDPSDIARLAQLRNGSGNPQIAGPMGSTLLYKLTDPDNGVVLDSWIDADGQPQGGAVDLLQ